MEVAVVILNWNGKSLLQKMVPILIKHSPGAHIYVADNASTDDSLQYLKNHYPEVRLIPIKKNLGFAGGYNYALKQVPEELLILLNSDVEVGENWLPPLLRHFKENPETGIAQPKIKDYYNRSHFEYAGAAGGFIDKLGYPFCRGRIFDHIEKDQGQYNDDCEVFWASGACFAIRNSLFQKLKGFDETYFAHQEEIDLCWRAQLLGHRVFALGESQIYHMGGATLSKMNARKTYLNFRNSLFNLVKNKSGTSVFPSVFLRMVLDGVAFFGFLAKAQFQNSLAILKAHLGFYQKLPTILRKRKQVKRKKKPLFRVNCIIWLYFCRSRKQYRQIRRR